MIAVAGLLIIITLSIVVVRIGSVALELTGLPPEIASFQAQSAFSGVGFTTKESEAIVSHSVRRRIIRTLILFGSAGVTTSMAALVLAFVNQTKHGTFIKIEVLLIGLILIYLFARSRYLYKLMKILIRRVLRRYTTLRIYDYEQLFGLGEGYAISKILVKKNSFMNEKPIKELKKELEGILVLGIYRRTGRRTNLIGAPHGDIIIKTGDELICYSKEETINEKLLREGRVV